MWKVIVDIDNMTQYTEDKYILWLGKKNEGF